MKVVRKNGEPTRKCLAKTRTDPAVLIPLLLLPPFRRVQPEERPRFAKPTTSDKRDYESNDLGPPMREVREVLLVVL